MRCADRIGRSWRVVHCWQWPHRGGPKCVRDGESRKEEGRLPDWQGNPASATDSFKELAVGLSRRLI